MLKLNWEKMAETFIRQFMNRLNSLATSSGKPEPYGVSLRPEGTNFALHSGQSKHATLFLYEYPGDKLIAEIPLDPEQNKTGNVWHICVDHLPKESVYGWHLEKKKGKAYRNYFETKKILLDPFAKSVISSNTWGQDKPYAPKGAVIAENAFDWEDDKPLNLKLNEIVLYEMHVRGFTRSPTSQTSHPGTFLAIIEKIPHLLDLGINAVKLMPLQEFNEMEYERFNPLTGQRLHNYWGYSTVNFFSPMNRYASKEGFCQALTEFKTLVKALHKNGIEVILDVVFNHTAEGNEQGPLYSFKGIDTGLYYLTDSQHHLLNFTGCGNTVNCNHPVVRELIRDCLKYWVTEMHVDGFRFDLAAVMTRGVNGEPLNDPPLIQEISHDPILEKTKLIAEPWDMNSYQLGNFYPNSPRWQEWNDKYRDSVRRFVKGDRNEKKEFAKRLSGSEDIFWQKGSPLSSINFLVAHDGFTLRDLVSYNLKNNIANAENDRDGNSNNVSWNCGAEGETKDHAIVYLREKQRRNFHLILMLSQGVPMLMMGDEYGHTRLGNNNPWCQDNELNWFLWDKLKPNKAFYRFYKGLIYFRKTHAVLRREHFLNDATIDWHGIRPFEADWEGNSQLIAFSLKDPDYHLYAAFNPQNFSVKIQIVHAPENHRWFWIVNTEKKPPNDFYEENKAPVLESCEVEMGPYSSILLKSMKS